jgi:uncharacterized protein
VTNLLPDNSDIEPLTRTQLLLAMGVTALMLLGLSKAWIYFGSAPLLAWNLTSQAVGVGLGIGLGISAASAAIYRLWPAYQRSATFYLELVIKPLALPDVVWLGLLPGMSEELLFRGVMLPAIGLNWLGLAISSVCFGISHMSGVKHWPYAIWATVIGLILGFSAMETQNLLIPIVAHITTNIVSGLAWRLKYLQPKT